MTNDAYSGSVNVAMNSLGQLVETSRSVPLPSSSMTVEQGKLLLVLVAKQLDLLESIERSLASLNRKLP